MQYLTVQDLIWINLEVTGKSNDFDFMKLEEGTYYQYGYGGSSDLAAQAARFYEGFLKNQPFASGNESTAFIASLTFLAINGLEITWPVASGTAEFANALRSGNLEKIGKSADHHAVDVSEAAMSQLLKYAPAIGSA